MASQNPILSKLEEDFLGDLSQDTHELWEVYAFARHHCPDASADEILKRGNEMLTACIKRGWLTARKSRSDETALSEAQLLEAIDELGSTAKDPEKGVIALDLTDKAFSEISWL